VKRTPLAVIAAMLSIAARAHAAPCGGQEFRFDTERGPVRVWIPDGYDPATAATVVYVHGYHVDLSQTWTEHRLPQQFAQSGINAMFIAAAAPRDKTDTVVWPSLNALVASVAARLSIRMPTHRLIAIGHSGAYRTLAEWLDSPTLDTIVLLDAVYGDYSFVPWVRASTAHRLINIAHETIAYSDEMHRQLPATRRVDGLPLEGLPDAQIVYARTSVEHWALVTDGVALPLALRATGVERVAGCEAAVPLARTP
jgi:hypothetical protein